MPRVLEGIRVVDLSSGPAAGFATTVLADFGADVVKVEPPGGDRFRSLAAAPLWLRGKRSVVLDLAAAEGRERMQGLVRGADVVVVSGPPGRAARLGADPEQLLRLNPALIHCSLSGWGPRGAYANLPAYEGLIAAKSGRMAVFGGLRRREGPSFAAVPIATHAAAQGAVQGILAALLARERSGEGQRVETSLLRALLPYDLAQLLLVQLAERGEVGHDPAAMGGGMPTLNYHPIATSDGRWIQCGNLLEHLFFAFLDSIDLLGELLAEERFQGTPATWPSEVIEEARDRILLRVRERTAEEWMEAFRANGNVAAEPYLTTQEALFHPELVANGDVVEHEHPELGTVRQIGPIAELPATPGSVQRPAPAVGAHTDEVLAEEVRSVRVSPRGDAPPRGRPLDGVTVLEVATIIAAPLGASMLADLGARVIKVEPIGGDPYRRLLPGGLLAVKTNAGKESICLDLKSQEGRGVVRDLMARSDALIHNFRPGVPERLGIGYEQARSVRPDIVWVSANGYGPHCPAAARPSAHPVPGATMGGATYQAGAGMPPERAESLPELREAARQLMRANEPNPDPNTSVVIATATLLGLWAQARLGIGQPVYVNMLVANAWANGDDFLSYAGKPRRPAVDADLLGTGPLYRLYRARTGWVFLAIGSDAEWGRFVASVGRAGLDRADPDLAEGLAPMFAERDADDWEKQLTAEGVGCVRADSVYPGGFFANDAHARQNQLATPTQHARLGEIRRWGPLVTCGGGAESYGPGALAGDHTDSLLAELGRDATEIARLGAAGVVESEPVRLES